MAMARWAQQMRDGGGGHDTIASEFVSAAIECHPNMDEPMTQGMTQS
jgi:hypothetical protein